MDLANKLNLYFYTQAIEEIAEDNELSHQQKLELTNETAKAINNGDLISRNPLTGGISKNTIENTSPYITHSDLNEWLEKNKYPFSWNLKAPIAEPKNNAQKNKNLSHEMSGETKAKIAAAFEGLHFEYDAWMKALGDPPLWLKECRVSKGSRGRVSATWNPVEIGVALIDRGVPFSKISAAMLGFNKWQDMWAEKTDYIL